MKTVPFRLAAVAALSSLLLSVSSCVNAALQDAAIEETSLSGTFDFTLDATMGEMTAEDDDTKASAVVTTVVRLSWQQGAEISVINLTTGKALGGSLTADATGTTTTFSGTLNGTVNAGDKLLFLYPSQGYVNEQEYTPATVDFSNQTGHSNSGVPLCVYSIVTAGGNSFNRTSASFSFLMSYIQMNMFGLEANSTINSVTVDNIGSGVTIGITSTGITSTPVQGTITMTPPSSYKVKDDGTRAFYMSFAESAAVSGRTVTVSTENEYKSCPWTGAKLNNSTSYTTSLAKFTDARYVDLGLSVKWATMNVGATAPEGYGDYFAWGATEPWYEAGYAQEDPQAHWKAGKDGGYFWTNAPYQTSYSDTKWTKYLGSTTSSYKDASTTDADAIKTVLDPEDDTARANWGENWRMPTDAEWTELRNTENCTWTWTTLNGVNGYRVQSKKAGYTDKWIFLPAAGWRNSDRFYYPGSDSSYWSSSLSTRYPGFAYCVNFSVSVSRGNGVRYFGRSVRSVHVDDPNAGITGISLNKTSITLDPAAYETLLATVTKNSGAVNDYVEWSSSDSSVATVDASGKVTAVTVGTATITARTVFGGFTATCNVVVTGPVAPQMVDLGLSVKWATFNVGATAPEEYGDYFAWGETEPYYSSQSPLTWKEGKSEGYTLANYKYYRSEKETVDEFEVEYKGYTKYVPQSKADSYGFKGFYDNKTVLDPEDDAAHVNWGGSWRMPTDAEWSELRSTSNCTWQWVTYKGVNGYKVTSKIEGYTDNWIFLPASGYGYYNFLLSGGSIGYYWSSSLRTDSPYYVYYVHFNSDDIRRDNNYRNEGRSVRPVSE